MTTIEEYILIPIEQLKDSIKCGYKFLNLKNIRDNCKIFDDNPVLYIAAGPSLDENIDWIKENQNKFFIIGIGSSL
ncbi:6-hydroxymethylpterin diphosphokinase MptE-like protein [Aliarcobacter butzleri]|uniref:6-hydroxymethylpterin diphosphokinase MptE-like protein n=1 Tax=Aliarcobacter butzleri TaxID=28197 RepID=UPI003AFB6FCB